MLYKNNCNKNESNDRKKEGRENRRIFGESLKEEMRKQTNGWQ
jgi:hypothetical protein